MKINQNTNPIKVYYNNLSQNQQLTKTANEYFTVKPHCKTGTLILLTRVQTHKQSSSKGKHT